MHGSVCLFSKYLEHLFGGENLDELDISSQKNSIENIFKNINSLSTGWTGTCPIFELFNYANSNYTTNIKSLKNIISSKHQNTMNAYNTTITNLEKLFETSKITVNNPSGSRTALMPKFEYEFNNKNDNSLFGGQIYSDFINNLKPYVEELDGNIKTNCNSLFNDPSISNMLENSYTNFGNFDTVVATASNIMNENLLDLKDYFLRIQTSLMIFTWGFLIFFVAIIVIYIFYLCEGKNLLYILLIVLINILFLIIIAEFVLASFFVQVQIICKNIPRAMNFIFTGNYMISGNSASYPAQFGRGDSNMPKMFSTCLNGNGKLVNLFISSNNLTDLNSLQNNASKLYNNLNREISKSNLILNDYDSINNSIFIKSIITLELMKNNLYMATEGFGEDDIYNILSNIRTHLDSDNCSLTDEYYVIKESDCPSGSTLLTTIYNTTGVKHCYVIQNLESGATASYSGSSCENNYINTAISFIKQIDSLLDTRLEKVKNLQALYSESFDTLYNEIYSTSEKLNSTYSTLSLNIDKASSISNCGSTKFDLIDFCDLIGKNTAYKARIVLIFSILLSIFGFLMLFFFLIVLNSLNENDNNYDNFEEGYNYSNKSKRKIRKININVNKSNYKKKNTIESEEKSDGNNDNYNAVGKKQKNMEMQLFESDDNNNSSDS